MKLVTQEMKVDILHITFVRIGLVTMHAMKTWSGCIETKLCFLFLPQSFRQSPHRSFLLFGRLRNR